MHLSLYVRPSASIDPTTELALFAEPGTRTVADFMSALEVLRRTLAPSEWANVARHDPVIARWRFFLCADPYTRWGLLKPRGYSGDATLMDYACGHESVMDDIAGSGDVGRYVYEHTSTARQTRSVQRRVEIVADRIAQAVEGREAAQVVAVGSGHARELEHLSASTLERLAKFTAVDTDPEALSHARRSARGVSFVGLRRNAVRHDLREVGTARFVYSLGLFDHLADGPARTALRKMWALVEPGGRLCVAQLAPDAANLGYCEAIMDLWQVTRSELAFAALAHEVVADDPADAHVGVTRHGCFNYLEMSRIGPSDR